ncbi:MAG: S8/S53 family peptidase [Ferruginibacter sp.]
MNRIHRDSPLLFIALVIVILILLAFLFYCKCFKNIEPTPPPGNEKISWNILFKEGTDKNTRDEIIKNIQDYVQEYYDNYNDTAGTNYKPSEQVVFCPCDTLLYNYDFSSLFGAGPSVTTAQSKARAGGSGGAIVSNNIPINEPAKENAYSPVQNDTFIVRNNLRDIGIDTAKRLAIIDSGIDTSLFSRSIRKLIWTDPSSPTLYNFIPGQFNSGPSDQTSGRHGSAVAATALKAMEKSPGYPYLMILKALDNNNSGSTFSVSCALSYAIQKRATLINLSLGYYGEPDSILHHYLGLSASHDSIGVFAAAGNTPDNHTLDICTPNLNSNELKAPSRLFYPACFSPDFGNITSVTQINKKDFPCIYQNYSNIYINLGVHNQEYCCGISVGFINRRKRIYEGSSFATPVACGLKMETILATTNPNNRIANWTGLISQDPSKSIIKDGKYIEYAPNR